MPFDGADTATIITKCLLEEPIAPRQRNSQLPVHIDQAIMKAMAKERADRYVDVSSFVSALQVNVNTFFDPDEEMFDDKSYLNEYDEDFTEGYELENEISSSRVLPLTEQQIDSIDALLDEVVSLLQQRKYEKALILCNQVIQIIPNIAITYSYKGQALLEMELFDEALAAYGEAIRLEPHSAILWSNKSFILFNLHRLNEALIAADQAIKIDPNYIPGLNSRGNVLMALKYYKEALKSFERIIELDPNNAGAYECVGSVLNCLGRYNQAIVVYEKAIQLGSNPAINRE